MDAMAAQRFILCEFCTPAHRWHVRPGMSADEAMAWFYADHIQGHVDEVVTWAENQIPRCRTCQRVIRNGAPVHRPCFQPDCYCPCSYPERTADAD